MKRLYHPKLKMVKKTAGELDTQEIQRCRSLTMRTEGMMILTLKPKTKPDDIVFLVIDENTNELVAWSICFATISRKADYGAYFYVRKTQRRKGIGTKLLNWVKTEMNCPIVVYPDNKINRAFFKKNKKGLILDDWY